MKKLPAIRGRDELIKYLRGERITHKQAVLAKCYECMGYCADGKVDCEIADCPLYLFNPYRIQPRSLTLLGEKFASTFDVLRLDHNRALSEMFAD